VAAKNKIPDTWSIVELGDISSAIQYGFTAKAVTQPIGPRFLRITDIQNDSVDWGRVPFCSVHDTSKEKYLLEQDDLLFARTEAYGMWPCALHQTLCPLDRKQAAPLSKMAETHWNYSYFRRMVKQTEKRSNEDLPS